MGGGHDTLDIRIANMTPVLPQMCRNAITADRCHDLRRTDGIGMIAAARIANGRDMVNIHAQAQARRHGRACHSFRLPGFTASVAASSGGSSSDA